MKKQFTILVILVSLFSASARAQLPYEVEITSFSNPDYDEFCPTVFQDKLVFCSNQEDEFLLTYQGSDDKTLFNIFMVNKDSLGDFGKPEILSRDLITPFNDGPAAYSPDGKTIVYSRNIDVKTRTKNIFDKNNNLGLYFANEIEGKLVKTNEFVHNNIEYSITTPCYGPEGKYLYFASDKPGGYGGADLYRCVYEDSEWSEPENLGEQINTKGNEAYPFIAPNGDLYFASDGHKGLGKKDIFLSRMKNGEWMDPVHLLEPINSKEDDFGLITDAYFEEGYFSSNRNKSDDIFRFSTLIPQLIDCDVMLENNYCYEFWDDMVGGLDTLPVTYEWVFSDGEKKRGLVVQHCFEGAGDHWANLNIIDNTTSNTFFTQTSMDFTLTDHEQPYINSRNAGMIRDSMTFNALKSNLPGYIVDAYLWDFGDESYAGGPEVRHAFRKTGIYKVKLGLRVSSPENQTLETRCVVKDITLVRDNQDLAMLLSGKPYKLIDQDISDEDRNEIEQDFSVFEVDPDKEVFRVEVLESEDKIFLDDSIFDPLRKEYDVKEFYLPGDSVYSYTVGEFDNLLSTYNVYSDVVDKGFTSSKVQTYVLAELPTAIIEKINRDFAAFSDANFEFNKSAVSISSYPVLDRVVEIMRENPDLAMEIAAHTDNIGSFEYNMDLSQKRAESILNYLVSQGIERIRLQGKGYGESRPISTNATEEGREQNRRVEFIILNQE